MKRSNSELLYLLRIIAASCVFIGHLLLGYNVPFFCEQKHWPYIQNVAVVIFYLLSGFLTMYTFSHSSKISFKEYFIDRWSRIYCGFIPAIIFVAVLDAVFIYIGNVQFDYLENYNIGNFILNLLMITARPFGSARSFWTLIDEWFLYMVTGFWTLSCYPKIKSGKKLKLWEIGMLIALAVIPIVYILPHFNYVTVAWSLGAMSFFGFQKINMTNGTLKLAGTGLLMLITLCVTKNAYNIFSILMVSFFFFVLMSWGHYNTFEIKLFSVKKIAAYTYSLYLTHISISYWIVKTVENRLLGMSMTIVISLIVAYVFYNLFESKYKLVSNYLKKKLGITES